MENSSKPLIWWHFSDIHWEATASTERQLFLDVLLDDLRNRAAALGTPDVIFITGDISFSGEEAQFGDADKHFITRIATAANNPELHLFMVPGNHDLRRSRTRTINPTPIREINSNASLSTFLDDPEFVDMINRPFQPFTSFARQKMTGATWEPLGWNQEVTIRDIKLWVIGTNTSWASTYHRNSQNQIDDERHLLIGDLQLQSLLKKPSNAHLSFLLLHHPLSWLNGFNQHYIGHKINQHADIVLFGHTHTLHELSQNITTTGSTVYLPSPATYDRQNSESVEFARGYAIGTVNPDTRTGNVQHFKYSFQFGPKFSPFNELYVDGDQTRFHFNLINRSSQPAGKHKTLMYLSFSDALRTNPALSKLTTFLEQSIDAALIERHTLDYFDALMIELIRQDDIVEEASSDLFWEAIVIARGLLLFDLDQHYTSPARSYRTIVSADRLCGALKKFDEEHPGILKLDIDAYLLLTSLTLDNFSVSSKRHKMISEDYRRFWGVPWLLSRLLMYCDYPALISMALKSEARLAELFVRGAPDPLSILSYKLDSKLYQLIISLAIQDRDGFLAVTLLKHYCDLALRTIGDQWRSSQRVLPPITVLLEFPRWGNRRIADYYLSVETTPIVKLLMGRAMYRDAEHVWFRELVQNALDANSARRALETGNYSSRLYITLSKDNVCTIRDNGIGMSRQHILRYLTTLGRSIWSSDDLHEGKPVTKDTAIRAMGKFGIGFAAVFQDAGAVLVRTRFFRDIGEPGWLVEFADVDEPFLLEAIDAEIGTSIEIKLKNELSANVFLKIVREYFLYLNEHAIIEPDPRLPKTLEEVILLKDKLAAKCVIRENTGVEQIGSSQFTLRTLFCYDAKLREKEERLPPRKLIISNSGVRVFEQESLILKPGQRYLLVTETESGPRFEDADDSGVTQYWAIVDFEKGRSPILPSRLEIDIDRQFSEELLEIIQTRFCEGLRSVISDLATEAVDIKFKRKAMINAMTFSTVNAQSWGTRNGEPSGFSRVQIIDETAIELYRKHCPIVVQLSDGEEIHHLARDFEGDSRGVFVIDSVAKSSLFRVYARASGLDRWAVVEGRREYFLFSRVVSNPNWKGFVSEKSLYSEGRHVFFEDVGSPLTELLRADYALIADDIFDGSAFIVLPSNLPGAWKRGEAAASSRRDSVKSCPQECW